LRAIATPRDLSRPKKAPVVVTEGFPQGDAGRPHKAGEIETWLTAPAEEALKLRRSLPDNVLKIVVRGGRNDSVDSMPF
jgi:hypothetical protein